MRAGLTQEAPRMRRRRAGATCRRTPPTGTTGPPWSGADVRASQATTAGRQTRPGVLPLARRYRKGSGRT